MTANLSIKPVLIFGYGNPSRGDDALGPLLLDWAATQTNLDEVELLTDFQLQIEHALDLVGRQLVLFVDASVQCRNAFDFTELTPARDDSHTTHAMSPSAVLAVYQTVQKQEPPPCFLLSIKGESFGLGEEAGLAALHNLQAASEFTQKLLSQLDVLAWRRYLQT